MESAYCGARKDVEERRAALNSIRRQLFDQSFKRHVLIGISLKDRLPHLPQQRAKIKSFLKIRAQHQFVDEKADKILRLQVVAIGD